jgi:hypothetical protein
MQISADESRISARWCLSPIRIQNPSPPPSPSPAPPPSPISIPIPNPLSRTPLPIPNPHPHPAHPSPSLPKKLNGIVYLCFLGHVQKDACWKDMKLGGAETSRSLTTAWLVTKTMKRHDLELSKFATIVLSLIKYLACRTSWASEWDRSKTPI